MAVQSIDKRRGLIALAGTDADLVVWQDLPGWTNRPGRTLELTLPDWAHRIEVWAWDGLRRQIEAHGDSFVLDGLDENETYMIRLPRTHDIK
jgi:hypothetical protein